MQGVASLGGEPETPLPLTFSGVELGSKLWKGKALFALRNSEAEIPSQPRGSCRVLL